ncbi:MAG: UvrD-helicase domain-containing protein [Flavobacteriaceae bacterium]|jgi:ATP-dependent exoDNAse (exonuclease V) beta subunit|nr:UvrD-helicase domain-containing protein [Flavobacteriaceae bacterium]
MGSEYTIYNASAGAGKTYTLVKNFLSLLLGNENPESISSILAVTFTNKAANEMKTRILSWLKDFSDPESYMSNPVLLQIAQEIKTDSKTVSRRARQALSYILHHYSLVSVSTIDKFNLRLMKSFTKELGLSYAFAIELDASDYLKQSINELVNELGTENPFAEVILNYIFWKFENESSTDIRNELLISSQNFLKEMHLEKITSITKKDFKDFKKLNRIIIKRMKANSEVAQEAAKGAISLIEKNGLEVSDFFQGVRGLGGVFYKIIDKEQIDSNYKGVTFTSSYYRDFCEKEKYAKANSPKEEDIRFIAPQLIQAFYRIKQAINQIKIDDSVFKNLITIELQSEIARFLDGKKSEHDVVFLSDVNPIISNHLKEEPVAFIYEKLGGKYNHYFIDEFQDTSQLQWNNFLPLLENAKVSDGASITLVGDPKQAIYRFRSGKPEILIDLISSAKAKNIEVVTLQDNYRSLPNIVDFNNKLYQFLADTELENPEYHELFGVKSRQFSRLKEGGRVQVSFVPPPDEQENYLAQKALDIIEEALSNGFSFKDIAILVRNKKHSFPIVDKVVERGFPILTEEALLISSSPAVQTIISALRWIANPQDKEQLVRMLYQLWSLGKIQLEDFTAEMFKIKDLTFTEVLTYLKKELNLELRHQQAKNLSFFDFAEEFISSLKFGKEEDLYISALLDMILQLERGGTLNLNEFLENWELKSPKLSIKFPDNMNAIRIMTIHKSKGLEFPVVIYPIIAASSHKGEEYWFPLEKELYNGFEQYYTSSKAGLAEVDESIKEVVDIREFEIKIDNLCVQYVATTRASQQLFLIEERKEKADSGHLEKFLQSESYSTEGTIELYPEADRRKVQGKKQEESVQEDEIQWSSERWNQKIRVSTEIHKFYSEENKEIQHGNIVHAVLAEITTGEELPLIIKRFILSGLIDTGQEEEIRKLVQAILVHPRLKNYFSKEAKVYTEQEILFEGRFYRPDRLVETENMFTIIDFKTGKNIPSHKKQVEEYAQVLQSLGKKIKEKLVIYMLQDKIEILEI